VELAADAALSRLQDPDEKVRISAISLLRRLRVAEALPVLARWLLENQDSDEYFTVLAAISTWHSTAPTTSIEKHLDSEDADVRAAACITVVQTGGKKLIPKLAELAAHDIPLVASAALRALAQLSTKDYLKAEAITNQRNDSQEINAMCRRWAKIRRV
jgi:HEAT repeat protein